MPKESLPHLFQKFYRVDNSDRRRIGGTGLGLAIVDEVIKSHGGYVTVFPIKDMEVHLPYHYLE
ncbi:ATP-binding protein [Peribacillus simplex]|uniref:ATP-binding protein n=1 Tax=Peribacillus simplex TaxID=1478 RepID=UPI00399ACF9A